MVTLVVFLLQLMQEDGTEARTSDVELAAADQQTTLSAAAAVSDAGTEAPSSSSTVAPSTSFGTEEIANGYRYGSLTAVESW